MYLAKGSNAYQSTGVGAINTEQRDRGAGVLGRGGIGAQAVDGRTGHGELLGGTEAVAGNASGHHRGIGGEESLKGEGETGGVGMEVSRCEDRSACVVSAG